MAETLKKITHTLCTNTGHLLLQYVNVYSVLLWILPVSFSCPDFFCGGTGVFSSKTLYLSSFYISGNRSWGIPKKHTVRIRCISQCLLLSLLRIYLLQRSIAPTKKKKKKKVFLENVFTCRAPPYFFFYQGMTKNIIFTSNFSRSKHAENAHTTDRQKEEEEEA